ncbi:hypothetical protein [uncultured Nostoc sp.]|uniref:hypothetical protein n=1 Tax=uncultured Nostoc sp. TaxID=340711 RepID=UPI0035CA9005
MLTTAVIDTTSLDTSQTKNSVIQSSLGLKLKMQQGLDSVGKFYQHLVSQVGEAVGVADRKPYTEHIPGALAGCDRDPILFLSCLLVQSNLVLASSRTPKPKGTQYSEKI